MEVVAIASSSSRAWRVPSHESHTRSAVLERRVDVVKATLSTELRDEAQAAGLDAENMRCGVVLAVVVLASGFRYDALCNLSKEEQLQYNAYRRLRGERVDGSLFFLEVVEKLVWDEPVPMAAFSQRRQTSFCGVIDAVQLELIRDALGEQALPAWYEEPIAVLQLPPPFACMCTHGAWSSIGVCNLRCLGKRGGLQIGWRLTYIGQRGKVLFDGEFAEPRFVADPAVVNSSALDTNPVQASCKHPDSCWTCKECCRLA